MSDAAPLAAAAPAGDEDAPRARPRRFTRAWFRARLERDPRSWVLLLAALEGLATLCVDLQAKRELFYGSAVGLAVLLGFVGTLPALGVAWMIGHGRLLFWSGKLLGGRAAPREIHAAFAWAQVPLIVGAAPFIVEIPLRAVAAEAERVPRWISAALRGLDGAADVLLGVAMVAALVGALLYVRFLAEAQRFSSWRAVANHVLAALLGVALTFAGVFAAARLMPGAAPYRLLPLSLALTVLPPLLVERVVLRRRRPQVGTAPG